ncbi:MAG: response regulator [Cyclobacteriaceae bacterium]
MSRHSILIVEDEPLIADDIAMILEKNQYIISGIVDCGEDAIDAIKAEKPDLALLDINIEGEMDGVQLAHHINMEFQIPFVFLTSYYDRNTIQRVKATNPAGYIVKPYSEADLVVNLELAVLKTPNIQKNPPADKFFIRDHNELNSIDPDHILYVESDDNYANIFTDKKKHVVSHTLKSVEQQLSGLQFVRTHKSYLVNFKKVTSIHEGYVFIEEIKIPIGRTYKDQLLKNLAIL